MQQAGSTNQSQQLDQNHFNSVLKEANKLNIIDVWRDARIRKAFEKFNTSQVSSTSLLALSVAISVAVAVHMFRYLRYLRIAQSRTMLLLATALTAMYAVIIVVLWIVTYLRFKNGPDNNTWVIIQLRRWQPFLNFILPVGMSAFYGLNLILRALGGECEGDALYKDSLMCNPNHQTHGMPSETLAQLLLLPIMFHVVLRDSMLGTLLLSWLAAIACILISAFILSIQQNAPFVVVYFLYSMIILYDNQRQNVSLFFLAEKLGYTLAENERLAEETHASELRHMIANVAHDLKTPLTSFLSGIECISQIVLDWDERLSDPAKYPDVLSNVAYSSDNLTAIHNCLDSIRNTNSFMIMTINRCIDYTKASKGLKLIPKPETIELQETIDLPIKVMRDFKTNLAINLLPIDADICTHIISDRQWLQENLLCLMSNAVKYSSKGIVEVSVKLVVMPLVCSSEGGGADGARSKPQISPKRGKHNSFAKVAKVVPSATSGVNLADDGSGGGGGGGIDVMDAQPGAILAVPSRRSTGTAVAVEADSATIVPSGSGSQRARETTSDPDSTKIRKLSNFVFNHAYSTIGRSKIFTDIAHSENDKERDPGDDVVSFSSMEEGRAGGDAQDPEHSAPRGGQATGQFLLIEVQDTGIGLSAEAMQTLFNPFKQAQRLAGGTGLGLYSLAKRIEALNGHYGVSHRRDGRPGSLFWFAIPYRPDTELAKTAHLKHHKGSLSRGGGSGRAFASQSGRYLASRFGGAALAKSQSEDLVDLESAAPSLAVRSTSSNSVHTDQLVRMSSGRSQTDSMSVPADQDSEASKALKLNILLVDDSLSILKMTSMMLRRSGHNVEQADNGAMGLELILKGYEKNKTTPSGNAMETPYDVVLMDLQMPVMDGLEAVRRLRAAERELQKKGADVSVMDLEDDDNSECRPTIRNYFFGRGSQKKQPPSAPRTEATASPQTSPGTDRGAGSGSGGGAEERRMSLSSQRHQLVIGVSANSDNETMVEAMKSGFDAFIGKPFSIDAFYDVLQAQQDKVRQSTAAAASSGAAV